MEPAGLRPSTSLSQRVHDIAERLGTHAKAEIYELLEGIASGGEVSSLLRLEPVINDIVSQLNDNFKQAVTKRLLPEACKLLGARPSALLASGAPGRQAGQTPPAQATTPPSTFNRQSLQRSHDSPLGHQENDILALALAPGTGQPLRSDQGPPQDAASAAASSLLLGAPVASPDGPADSASSQMHPPASRFAFANAEDSAARSPQYPRGVYGAQGNGGGGGLASAAAADAATAAVTDSLLFLGLGENGTTGSGGGGILGLSAGDIAGFAGFNGLSTGADATSFLLEPSCNGSARTTIDGAGAAGAAGGFLRSSGGGAPQSLAAPLSPPSSVSSSHGVATGGRQLHALSLGAAGPGTAAGSQVGVGVRPASSSASAGASPSTQGSPLSYSSMPLAVRPGSSLDPGLATPPVSLSGTEPLRSLQHLQQLGAGGGGGAAALAVPAHLHAGENPYCRLSDQQHLRLGSGGQPQQQYSRLSGPSDLMASPTLAPLPLFGGAPGPSPGPSPGGGGAGLPSSNGNAAGGAYKLGAQSPSPPPQQQQQHLQLQQQFMRQQPPLQPGQQQQQQPYMTDLQRPSYGLQHPNLQQQQFFGQTDERYSLLSGAGRAGLAAAPDGPRPGLDGGLGPINPNSAAAYALQAATAGPGGEALSYNDVAAALYGTGLAANDVAQYGGACGGFVGGADGVAALALRGGLEPAAAAAGGGGVRVAAAEYGMYGFPPLGHGGGRGHGHGEMQSPMQPAGGGGHLPMAMGPLSTPLPGMGAPGAASGMAMGGGGSPPSGLAVAPPLFSGPGARSSRSGAGSAASVVDSRSSSFSTGGPGQGAVGVGLGFGVGMSPGGGHMRSGSGGGGGAAAAVSAGAALLANHLQPSPPASDASGPSSVASVSTGGGAGVLAGSGAAAGGGGGVGAGAGSGGKGQAGAVGAGGAGGGGGTAGMSMAAKLQQVATKPMPSPGGRGGKAASLGAGGPGGALGGPLGVLPASGAGGASSGAPGAGTAASSIKAPADMPGRFRCLPPSVQARIHTLTRDNHVVLLKDFDEKVLSKMTLLVDKFGAGECLAMLDRIEEVLKGKAGRLANGPGYLDVSVSTRLDELKQRASGQVTAPEDYARSTLHSRIYAELRDLIARHGFLQWHHFDQGIINMLKKMPNATALERLNELAYHSFKNVDNPKSCIVSIFTTKPKYVNA